MAKRLNENDVMVPGIIFFLWLPVRFDPKINPDLQKKLKERFKHNNKENITYVLWIPIQFSPSTPKKLREILKQKYGQEKGKGTTLANELRKKMLKSFVVSTEEELLEKYPEVNDSIEKLKNLIISEMCGDIDEYYHITQSWAETLLTKKEGRKKRFHSEKVVIPLENELREQHLEHMGVNNEAQMLKSYTEIREMINNEVRRKILEEMGIKGRQFSQKVQEWGEQLKKQSAD